MTQDGPVRTVPRVLAATAQRHPDTEALVDGAVRLTYRELAAQVRRATAAAMASGIAPGDRVAIWAPNGHRWVVAALGALGAGAVLVPVNTRYKGEEAAWLLARSKARTLFVDNGFLGHDYLDMLRDSGASAPGTAGRRTPGPRAAGPARRRTHRRRRGHRRADLAGVPRRGRGHSRRGGRPPRRRGR